MLKLTPFVLPIALLMSSTVAEARFNLDTMMVEIYTDEGDGQHYTYTNGSLYCKDGFAQIGQVKGMSYGSYSASPSEVTAVNGQYLTTLAGYLAYAKAFDLSCFPRSKESFMVQGTQYVKLINSPAGYKPVVSVTVVDEPAHEQGDEIGRFLFTLNAPYSKSVKVAYKLGGSAKNGRDYKLTGSATIPVGATSVFLNVVPKDDTLSEDDETVTLTLKPSKAYSLTEQHQGELVIVDND